MTRVINDFSAIGAHVQNGSIATATTITKPHGATHILLQATAQNVRYTVDGSTAPTTTKGFSFVASRTPVLMAVPGASLKVIEEASTAVIEYQWLGP